MDNMSIYRIALDSLSAQVAILDEQGVILETNRAWRDFALANNFQGPPDCVGINYLQVCAQGSSEPYDEPAVIGINIRRVLNGEIREFLISYPCHSPTEERWFTLRVVPFREPGARKVILAHENITPLVKVQQDLAARERELREKTVHLEESNIALKVLLKQREEDRNQLEEKVLANVRTLVLPYVQQLCEVPLPARERALVQIIQERLQEVISPFLGRMSALHAVLSPNEIQVATQVKEGRSSHEIADVLGLAVSTIDFHRKNIRKKLGLSGRQGNLRSYLLSLQ